MAIHLIIVTPQRTVLERPVDQVVIPGGEGEFGILPGHESFLSALQAGVVRYVADGKPHRIAVSAGFAEVTAERVTLLARTAEPAEEIDRSRAEAALARAGEVLRQVRPEDQGEKSEEQALTVARAKARIRALGA